MKKIKVATVFSGIGAPEFALRRLGVNYEMVFACDNGDIPILGEEEDIRKQLLNKNFDEQKMIIDSLVNPRRKNFVRETYFNNYKISQKHFHHDIRFLDGTQYQNKVDLLVGGSPCQAFSTVGYKKGLEDARGTLFYEYARIVNEVQPKVFIYENVAGLLTHDKGNTWEIVKNIFLSLGYKISFQKINSKEYGIPQNRNRIFVVGTKGDDFVFPKPIELKYELQDFLENHVREGDFISENGEIKIKKSKFVNVDNDRFYPSDRVVKHIMSPGTKNYFSKIEIDLKIARPILATMHKMHRASVDNYITDKAGRVRMLTPREVHRVMGFTDDFKINQSNTQAWKQAGNSIVVDVLMAIIGKIIEDKYV